MRFFIQFSAILIFGFQIFILDSFAITPELKIQYEKYLKVTLHSMDTMRGANGFIVDKAKVIHDKNNVDKLQILNPNTSMTNVALDLIIQAQLAQQSQNAKEVLLKINRILETLKQVSYHKASGLFFSWYSTNESNIAISKNISSIDNLHIALALFTLKETIQDVEIKAKASDLFKRMDFSMFYDDQTGLLFGNYIFQNNQWVNETYHYKHLGSEARILYPIGWSLGLFKKLYSKMDFYELALSKMYMEFFEWENQGQKQQIMKTWDGGAFQLFLPQLLINEDNYSTPLGDSFKAYSDFIIAKGVLENIPLPAGYSASNYGDNSGGFESIPEYNGHSGSPELVSDFNSDFKKYEFRKNWDLSVTPHAIMLAATANPTKYAPILQKSEKIQDDQLFLYNNTFGWLDGVHVKGKYTGKIVPIILSLDQGMLALSLMKILSQDSSTLSARALQNHMANLEIKRFYKLLNQKITQLPFPNSKKIP